MKRIKKIAALVLAAALAVSVAACGSSVKDDGKVYLQGLMDSLYLGQQNEDYLKLFDMTAEEATEEYQTGLGVEAEYFAKMFGIENLNDPLLEQIKDLLARAYKNAKYTIKSSSKLESGNYAMEVEIEPIDVLNRVTEDDCADAWAAAMDQASILTEEDAEEMSEEAYILMDNDYAQRIIALVEDRLAGVGHLPAVTVTMTLMQDMDGYYDYSQDDFNTLDAKIMPYFAD